MRFYIEQRNGSVRAKSCKVSGVVIDGTAYCSFISGSYGSFAAKVSACDACED